MSSQRPMHTIGLRYKENIVAMVVLYLPSTLTEKMDGANEIIVATVYPIIPDLTINLLTFAYF